MSEAAVECVVVGAGVVGLAVARALAKAGIEVMVLEREYGIGFETSSRNSEVIHAGIYYPKDSLKALTCVEGKRRLYAYCAAHGVPHKRLGKLIVACSEEELPLLDGIRARAAANGVEDLVALDARELRRLEPALAALGGLLSPSTGIIDSHALMLAYQGEAEAAGAMVVFRAPVEGGALRKDGFMLEIGGAEPMRLACRMLVNSAGLYAPALARRIAGIPAASIPRDYLCRGVYFTLSGKAPFSRLIYPVPEKAGLGVHLTLDLAGQARFGPDVEWIDRVDYTVDPRRGDGFYAAIRRYWPGLPDGALQPGYAGIRPKITGPGEAAGDFVVQGPQAHGIPGLVNLYGIESPGLTASLALADRVLACLAERESALAGAAGAG
ncbi:MAG TPA: NAD(P)/FAD-dependent oxidoreductase [Stellaceae bacterium]|nr:NAD(P)/FAD-dependent oxidoreductase [Stellaceae bacterium]